jgi:threonine/homoserine/homoserine lactone efflux protein
MNIILQGIILGFTLSTVFGFGPALFALIQTSIHRGFWSGVQLAFGVFLSDASLIAVGALGFGQIFYMPRNQMAFGIIGGILLVIFGIVTYSRKVKVQQNEEGEADQANTPGPLTYIFKGFFINFTNPFVWIFWMGVVVGFYANYSGEH